MNSPPFSSLPLEQLLAQLQSTLTGLESGVAAKRSQEQRKLLPSESRFQRELKLLVRQFSNPLLLLLVVAVILSAMLGKPPIPSSFSSSCWQPDF
ncbi:cation-transporting P-type ATPase [Larkinella sp. C7]|uniref:cation-transporting P-type ATPase n=1 Tax=Larkinella sp. C7 TaxID=2576607 RepID=UPI0034D9803F